MAKKPKKPIVSAETNSVEVLEPGPSRNQLMQFWDRFKQITLYQAAVTGVSVISALAPAYVVVKSIAANAAEGYIIKVMDSKGVKIDDVKNALKKVEEIERLKTEQLTIQSDLATIKNQSKKNEQLLEKLLELELNDQR